MEDARCLDVIRGEGGEVGEGPTSPDAATGEDAVCGFAFEPYASAKEDGADCESAEDLAAGSPRLKLPGEE